MDRAVWYPTEEVISSTRLYKWMRKLGFTEYEKFCKASINDITWFWSQVTKALEVEWFTPYSQILDLTLGPQWPRWFIDGRLNVTYNAVDKWLTRSETAKRLAIIAEREDGRIQTFSYKQLADWVNQIAGGLKQIGVEKGDRVGIYMPMIPEAVVAMLASVKIGAIITPCFSGFGYDPVAKRLEHAEAKVLITADGFVRKGKIVSMKEEADKAANLVPSIRKLVVVRYLGRDIPWRPERDIEWSKLEHYEPNLDTEPMESSDPFMLIYTSGTTGRPKGTVHTHAGFPIKCAFDAGFMLDVQPGERFFWVTDMGWVMGPFVLFGSLLNGATLFLYDGSPDYPTFHRLWEMVDRHRINILGISPTLIRSQMSSNNTTDQYDLSALKAFASTGEPWNEESWYWVFEKVGKANIPILNISGGTEVSGAILGTTVHRPIAPATFNTPIPGMDVAVFGCDGNSVVGQAGELVVKQPWVGMTNGFWKDSNRYEETYWDRWPNIWVQGDAVVHRSDGFWEIIGRSDDTLNIAGKRMGPVEIESILADCPLVKESAVVGVPDPVKGEVAVCFVVLHPGNKENLDIKNQLLRLLSERLGRALLPREIHFVSDLPKTRSAKIMRRVIRAIYLGQEPGDLSSLENPESLDELKKV